MNENNDNFYKNFRLNSFLDERLISGPCKGGIRDWLCPSYCLAEKVYWKEVIEDQFYERSGNQQTTLLLLQPKLGQLCDLIRSSEEPKNINLCIEGMISGRQVLADKPHRSLFYTSQKLNLEDRRLTKLNDLIRGSKQYQIAEVLMEIFENSLDEDFPNLRKGTVVELLSAKIYFQHC